MQAKHLFSENALISFLQDYESLKKEVKLIVLAVFTQIHITLGFLSKYTQFTVQFSALLIFYL